MTQMFENFAEQLENPLKSEMNLAEYVTFLFLSSYHQCMFLTRAYILYM